MENYVSTCILLRQILFPDCKALNKRPITCLLMMKSKTITNLLTQICNKLSTAIILKKFCSSSLSQLAHSKKVESTSL